MPVDGSALTGDKRPHSGTVVLIPVKEFSTAKHRLSSILTSEERSRLARVMADRVLRAARPLEVVAICRTPAHEAPVTTFEVGSSSEQSARSWADQRGIPVIEDIGLGLSHAVGSAATQVCAAGAREVIVAHGDLPFAADLQSLSGFPGITIVPDRHGQGTNIICLPEQILGSDEKRFEFSYGPGSFERHHVRAVATGLPWRIVDDPRLTCDIDEPADIDFLVEMLESHGLDNNGPESHGPDNDGLGDACNTQKQAGLPPDDLGWIREVVSASGNRSGHSHAAS